MSKKEFFPRRPEANPTIYAYKLPDDKSRDGQLKIGFTTRSAQERIEEQIGATRAKYEIVLIESAIRNDGSSFADHEIHKYLRKKGFVNTDGEWFKCSVRDVKAAILAVKTGELNEENRTLTFKMRPEQKKQLKKQYNILKVLNKKLKTETKPQVFCGMQKCVLVKHLLLIN